MGYTKIQIKEGDFEVIDFRTFAEAQSYQQIHENSRKNNDLSDALRGESRIYEFDGLIYEGELKNFSWTFDKHYSNTVSVNIIKDEYNIFNLEIPYLDESKKNQIIESLKYQLDNSKYFDEIWYSHGMYGTEKIVLSAYRIENSDDIKRITIDGKDYIKGCDKVYSYDVSLVKVNNDMMIVDTNTTKFDAGSGEDAERRYNELKQSVISKSDSEIILSTPIMSIINSSESLNNENDYNIVNRIYGQDIMGNMLSLSSEMKGDDPKDVIENIMKEYIDWLRFGEGKVFEKEIEYDTERDIKRKIKFAIRRVKVISFPIKENK